MKEIQRIARDHFGETAYPRFRPNGKPCTGNYGKFLTLLLTLISFDIFQSFNNPVDAPEEIYQIMDEDSKVFVLPGESNDSSDSEGEFQLQGERKKNTNDSENEAAKKKPNIEVNLTIANPSVNLDLPKKDVTIQGNIPPVINIPITSFNLRSRTLKSENFFVTPSRWANLCMSSVKHLAIFENLRTI
ncbi:hypothetical protein AVEN_166793-1 [Araneus ventricosus]|uniref:Uncharacterized protein n=1 Tax=Araneus ventricosus TaxID=182803 RepID=A0A4Y2BR53_ARAVE|nr:hypothetical protein AVEN_166793-1 [Araneus ventricosus]